MKKYEIGLIALLVSIVLGGLVYALMIYTHILPNMPLGVLGISGLTFILTVFGLKKWKK